MSSSGCDNNVAGPPEDSLKLKTKSYLIESVFRRMPAAISNEWRILVVDYHSMRVLSSACTMHDIMNEGICLVENIEDETRERMPHLPALYFLTPCASSISALIQDFATNPPRYGHCAVYFTSELTHDMFDMFKNTAVVPYMRTLKEVNVDYLAYESRVFSFDAREGFALYFDDALVELRDPYQREMSEKLASLCAVVGAKPSRIRYALPAAQTAAYTKRALEALPLTVDPACKLFIVDRSIDMISPLLHEFTYMAMLEDVLDETVHDDEWTQQYTTVEGEVKTRALVLDEQDPVLYQLRHKHIEETIHWLVSSIRDFTKVNELSKNEAASSSSSDSNSTDLNAIQTFMHQLPKYQELGAKYSSHLDLTQLMLKAFKARKLAQLASVQQNVSTGCDATGKTLKPARELEEMKAMLSDPSMNKSNLFRTLLLLVASRAFSTSQIDDLFKLGAFGEREANAIANMRHLLIKEKEIGSHFSGLSRKNRKKPTTTSSVSFDLSRWTPLLKHLVEALSANTLDEEEYPTMTLSEREEGGGDRRLYGTRTTKASQRIIVFVIGGITYSEIRAMHELMGANRQLEILLGATHIIKPNEFVADLSF